MESDKWKNKLKPILSVTSILSIVRNISLIIFSGVFSWRLAEAGLSAFHVSDLKIVDIVSLMLAVFAIGMSAAFYFKANDVGNQFYDNMYKFTKDTSELLGRIEAGFGERLRHLDESYIGLRDRFDRLPLEKAETKIMIEKGEQTLHEKETERKEIINQLIEKSKLEADEKELIIRRLKTSEEELQNTRTELDKMRNKLSDLEEEEEEEAEIIEHRDLPTPWDAFTLNILKAKLSEEEKKISSAELFAIKFNQVIRDTRLPLSYFTDMQRFGFLDKKKRITAKGILHIKNLLNK